MKITVHVIQYEEGGIPYEPQIFINNKKKADEFFLRRFNEEFKKDFKTIDGAYNYQMSDKHNGDAMLRYWSIPIPEPIPTTSNRALRLYREASRSLLATYRRGHRNSESVDWEDVDVAHELAQRADRAERSDKKKVRKP